MGEGFDLIGKKKKDIREKLAERDAMIAKKQPAQEIILDQIKPEDPFSLIKNIVFARVPYDIDMETLSMNLHDAFMHENYLNLSELIKKRQLM